MHIYREDESEQARRMAVVALAELDSKLAVDYLERAHSFEKSDAVRKTIAAVVSAHRAT
jgi:HEAT repeat protein